MDWSLRSCGRRGHATYAPDEPELRARLCSPTPVGPAWRCLRCGDFVPGPPAGSGPADEAPEVLRGRALRDAVILRLLAVERWVRGLFLLLIGYGVWRFRSEQTTVRAFFDHTLPLVRPITDQIGYNLAQSGVVRLIREGLAARSRTLEWVVVGLAVYAVIELVEGVGLWLLARWGEYFAVVATGLFVPLEAYELVHRPTAVKALALVVNVAAVVYILLSKRLFGLRGGRAAYDAERHEESLLEVEAAAARDAAAQD